MTSNTTRATIAALALLLASCTTHRHRPPAGIKPVTLAVPTATGLDTLVRLSLPAGTPDISTAALFVLRGSGFAYTSHCPHCPAAAAIIARDPVSPLAYTGGITTIRRALLLIAGSHRRLIVDDRAKVVTFDDWDG